MVGEYGIRPHREHAKRAETFLQKGLAGITSPYTTLSSQVKQITIMTASTSASSELIISR